MMTTQPSDSDELLDDDGEDDAAPVADDGSGSHLDENGQPRIIERHLIVPPELAGLRLDHFVKTQIHRLSRTKIQAIIETQLRRADGGVPKASTTVAVGDHFIIRRQAKPEPPCPRTFTVLYEDARMRIVDKPAMLPVHATAKFYFNTLTRVLWERYPDEDELQLCHRLDRETSGCVVLARDREAAAKLKGAIAAKDKTTKQYLAVVHGTPPWTTQTTIDLPLRLAGPSDATKLTHVRMLPSTMAEPGAQAAMTRVVVDKAGEQYSLVRCTLVTGRQHQIRAHLAARGFPIVGVKIDTHGDDAFIEYCAKGMTPELAAQFVLPRHALHAARITVPHPEDNRPITAEAPLPADMASLLDRVTAEP
ncbi:MAG TPA: RluA family pseudouridine synthase [Kofleriaceae bacterium]|nr:RluA family pseudouridine synthase [Kofleriaceae bacterium]